MSKCKRLVIFIAFLLLFALSSVNAAIYDRYQKLNAIETEHFKICFPPKDIDFARRTEVNCEKALSRINELLGTEWSPKGFPIIITDDIHRLNAYYTAVTSDHITLYNTLPDEGELNCFSDPEYSILLHELTHALTLSIKSPAFDFFSVVIGDAFNNMVFMNYGIIEGYAVMVESLSGEGRANDVFSMNSILQGMRNREILNYRRTSGALGSKYPAAKSAYVFTGAFLKHMYEKYGAEKMSEFTRRLPMSGSIKGLFSSVYGFSIDTAYDNFITGFDFPETAPSDKLVSENSLYSNLKSFGNALYFSDEVSGEIYRYDDEGVSSLVSTCSPIKFAFSNSGEFFGLLEYNVDDPVLKVYDAFRNNIRFSNKIANVHDFAFARCNGKDCLALYRYDGKNRAIDFVDINSGEVFGRHFVGRGEELYSLVQHQDGKIAFVSQKGLKANICVYDIENRTLAEFDDARDVVKRNLSYDPDSDRFVFSYAEHEIDPSDVHYPRLGVLRSDGVGSYVYELAVEDLEGGVLFPQIEGTRLAYVAEGYKQDSIMFADMSSLTFMEYPSHVAMRGISDPAAMSDSDVSERFLSAGTSSSAWLTFGGDYAESLPESANVPFRYKPFVKSFPFAGGGLFLPQVGVDGSSKYVGLVLTTTEFTDQFYSYLMADYTFPSGSDGGKKHVAVNYTHAFNTRKMLLALGLKPYLKFDKSVTQSELHFDFTATASAIWTKRFAENSLLQLSGNVSYDLPMYESNVYEKDGLGFNFNIAYQNMVPKGYGFRRASGMSVALRTNVSDVNKHFKNSNMLFMPTFEFEFNYCFPRLIPVQNTRDITYSLPLSLGVLARYKYSPYHKNPLRSDHNISVSLHANLHLFSVDLSEKFIDVPFVVNAIAFEFVPSATYLNYVEDPLARNKVFRGFKFDFSFLAYFRLSPTFLGIYFTSNSFDIGVRYSIGQDEVGGRFRGRPYFYLSISGANLFGGSAREEYF